MFIHKDVIEVSKNEFRFQYESYVQLSFSKLHVGEGIEVIEVSKNEFRFQYESYVQLSIAKLNYKYAKEYCHAVTKTAIFKKWYYGSISAAYYNMVSLT